MLLTVGQVVRPHGIRGEVVVEVVTDEPEQRYAAGATLLTEPPGGVSGAGRRTAGPAAGPESARPADRATPSRSGDAAPGGAGTARPASARAGTAAAVPASLTVDSARWHHGRLLVSFKDITDRPAAEALRGVVLRVDSAVIAPPPDPDEFHDHQLVGLAAVDPAGRPLGTVERVDHAPAADLLVIGRPGGGSALVPFVKAIVVTVDPAGGRVVVDPPAGLLDL